MRPYDVKTEKDLLSMESDNHPQESHVWTIMNNNDNVTLFPPAESEWVGWVEIPRDQFNAIVDWYMRDQTEDRS